MNNTTDTVENTNNDSTLKKAMNYFTEEVCGMLPSAKKINGAKRLYKFFRSGRKNENC